MNNTIESEQVFNPEHFIKDAYKIEHENLYSLRCIDDRETRQNNSEKPLPNYAIPGAGLGVAMDVMAAVYSLTNEKNVDGPEASELFSLIEQALDNKVSFHTDTMHDEGMACAGCGYCAGTLNDPENNFLPQQVAEYISNKGLAECKKSLDEQGIEIPAYEGPHVAKAVMIVKGTEIGLPSTSSSGEHAYVLHVDVRNELLQDVAETIYPTLQKQLGDATPTKEEWFAFVQDIADKRLAIVVEKLAKGLPQYIVEENESLVQVQAA